MWCYRLRAWQSSPLIILLSFAVAAGLVVQLKTLYDNHQKHLRIVDYGTSIDEMTATVEHVDRVTNRLSLMIKRIESYIDTERQRGVNATALR